MVILLICSLKLESITRSLVTTSINLFLQAVSNSESPEWLGLGLGLGLLGLLGLGY